MSPPWASSRLPIRWVPTSRHRAGFRPGAGIRSCVPWRTAPCRARRACFWAAPSASTGNLRCRPAAAPSAGAAAFRRACGPCRILANSPILFLAILFCCTFWNADRRLRWRRKGGTASRGRAGRRAVHQSQLGSWGNLPCRVGAKPIHSEGSFSTPPVCRRS